MTLDAAFSRNETTPQARQILVKGVSVDVQSEYGGMCGVQPTPEQWERMQANEARTHGTRTRVTEGIGRLLGGAQS